MPTPRSRRGGPGWVLYAAGGVLVVAVVVIGALMFGRPMWRTAAADGWRAAECTITRSEVDTQHKGPDTLDLEYRYDAGGRSRTGDDHSARHAVGLLSGAWDKHQRLDVGAAVPCWVDPDDPSLVTLDRSFDARGLFGLAAGLLPPVPGVYLVLRTRRLRRTG